MAQKPRNADYTKEYNRKAAVRILRRNAMSRAQLARATGLTRAATSLIVEELVKDGIVTELTPQSVGRGRSATPLALRADCYYALAVDLSRTGCSVGLCDIAGNLLQSRKIPDQKHLVEAIIAELRAMLETVERSKVLGIGISSPGPLDCQNGRILNPPQFECWHGVEISKYLSEGLDMPAWLERDVCALALHQLEKGQSHNFMLLFVGIGIGAAIMSGGKLLGHCGYFTGELGHTTIRFDGRLCKCGNRGCLETYASIPALLENTEFSGWKELMDQVEENADASRLLDQEAVYLSAGLTNLLNLIPVDTIYLAGDICYRYELLARRLQREIQSRVLDQSKGPIRIYPSVQDDNIGILAAAEVVFSRFLTV
ncbi:MAG: ROK family transcriptional regulator [Oscillospiraceae bacterium]|nr:ROK family transcriptional regulator [Oscillospiraceae bacterium]